MQIILFVGPPGAGKGTISQLCSKRLGWRRISTGELCRKHVQEQTEIGQQIDFAMRSGILVPDTVVGQMIDQWLKSNANNQGIVILDGYPRTVSQIHSFSKMLESLLHARVVVVKLLISDNCIVERLSNRYICQNSECQMVYSLKRPLSNEDQVCTKCQTPLGRRHDDECEIVLSRLKAYHRYEQELIDVYSKLGWSLHEINVERPLDTVFDHFVHLINGNPV